MLLVTKLFSSLTWNFLVVKIKLWLLSFSWALSVAKFWRGENMRCFSKKDGWWKYMCIECMCSTCVWVDDGNKKDTTHNFNIKVWCVRACSLVWCVHASGDSMHKYIKILVSELSAFQTIFTCACQKKDSITMHVTTKKWSRLSMRLDHCHQKMLCALDASINRSEPADGSFWLTASLKTHTFVI